MSLKLSDLGRVSRREATPDDIMNEKVGLSLAEEEMVDRVLNEQAEMIVAIETSINLMEDAGMADAINEACSSLEGALKDANIINEAISINTKRPKRNHVVLTKESQLKRLQMIFALNLARENKNKDFKRFKLGSKIRKIAKENILKRYGQKGMMMAKKAYKKASSTSGFNKKTAAKK